MQPKGEIAIYQSEDGNTSIEVNLQEETIWLTQKQMAVLLIEVFLQLMNMLKTSIKLLS